MSVVYPIARGTGPLISSFGAIVLLGERPSGGGLIGIVLIVAGILCIAGAWSSALYKGSARAATGLVFGVLTGLCIAAYTVNDAYAVKVLLVSPIMIDYFGNAVRLAFLTPRTLSKREALAAEWRRNLGFATAVGALMPLSYILSARRSWLRVWSALRWRDECRLAGRSAPFLRRRPVHVAVLHRVLGAQLGCRESVVGYDARAVGLRHVPGPASFGELEAPVAAPFRLSNVLGVRHGRSESRDKIHIMNPIPLLAVTMVLLLAASVPGFQYHWHLGYALIMGALLVLIFLVFAILMMRVERNENDAQSNKKQPPRRPPRKKP